MNSNIVFRNIGRFILLVLLQLLIFNNIYLGGYVNPCLYVLFIAMLPTNTGRIALPVIAFFTGLCIDVCTNMLGFNTFACTAVGFLRVIWLDKIILRDNEEIIETPSIRSVPYQQFSIYLFLLLFAFTLIYYTLMVFSLRNFFGILLSSLLSALLTWVLAILYQTLFLRKSRLDN